MHQLVYISTVRRVLTPAELRTILTVSRENNSRCEVTGLLVSGGTRFLQALEGPTQNVLQTFDRIKADPRHFACVILASRSAEKRSFGDWSMAYHTAEAAGEGTILDAVLRLTDDMQDKGLQAEFRTFAEMHVKAA